MLKDGIIEYICEKESSPKNSGNKSFFIQNGDISTEIHLACALHYFASGSYLDIAMSHAIGVLIFIYPFGPLWMQQTGPFAPVSISNHVIRMSDHIY